MATSKTKKPVAKTTTRSTKTAARKKTSNAAVIMNQTDRVLWLVVAFTVLAVTFAMVAYQNYGM